jgi:glycosyltransferase involved in cell wall biosynthesis
MRPAAGSSTTNTSSSLALNKPLVSIVTPSLNQARYLEAAILSVAEQDYPRVEHIVVDGGSTDGSLEILERYPSVQWSSEPDRGQADAVNKGFGLAQGAIFGWLNADDLYLPGALATAVQTFEETGVGLVYGGWQQIDEDGGVKATVPAGEFEYHELVDRNLIAQPATFFTREAFEAVGGLDPRYHYAMDFDLWLKIGARFEFRRIDRTLAAFRLHSTSKSIAAQDRFWPETRRISRRHGSRFFSGPYVASLATDRPLVYRLLMTARSIILRRPN